MLSRSLPASSYPAPFIGSSLLRVAQELVARTANVSLADLDAPTRGAAPTARARQQAMYLAHTVLGLSISAIARACNRHHSTVAHACRVVEEQRDDPVVDRAVVAFEQALSARCCDRSS